MKGGHKRRRMVPEPERHTEICNQILDGLRVMSREEWMKAAKLGKPGIPGMSPMRQLQFKIRESPLTFVPEILGVFRTPAGDILQRLIPWPSTGWRVALLHQAGFKDFINKHGVDFHPYRTIDPLIDELDRQIEEHGIKHNSTVAAARKLVKCCLEDFGYGKALP